MGNELNWERAIELREAGLSRSQIAAALGLKSSGGALSRWLKNIPPPAWTKRPNAKDDLREKAVQMRMTGMSYKEIQSRLGVSKSSLSLWLRDVPLTDEQREALQARQVDGVRRRAASIRARRIARETQIRAESAAQIPTLAESELFVAGVALYWAEGGKTKPWTPSGQVRFINSDPDVIMLFLSWLELVGIGKDRLIFRATIHESADEEAARRYWSDLVGVPVEEFRRSTIKTHKPKTVRHNTGDEYHGCLVVHVRRSADLLRQIAAWWSGVVAGADRLANDPQFVARPFPVGR